MKKELLVCTLAQFLAAVPLWGQNPIVRDQFTADPTARVFDGKLYLYPSHDIPAPDAYPRKDWFCMEDYHVFSSANLTDWTDHGVILSQNQVPWVAPNSFSMWAPDCVCKDGKYYFFFPSVPRDTTQRGFGVGVAIGSHPQGPFVPQAAPIQGIRGIDPCVLMAPNGKAYIYWSGQGIYVAPLKANMLELAGEPQKLAELPDGFKEGPFAFERNGIYYLTYPWVKDKTECLAYSYASSPMGPFKFGGILMDASPTGCWTNHHSIVEYEGQWYLFYHHNDYSPQFDKNRSARIDSLHFNPDGTIQKVRATLRGVGVSAAGDRLQLDRYSALSPKRATVDFLDARHPFEGWFVRLAAPGAWVRYNCVDFADVSASTLHLRVRTPKNCQLQIRLDGPQGTPVATLDVAASEQWHTVEYACASMPKGRHDLWVSLLKGKDCCIDWMNFGALRIAPYQNPELPSEARARDLVGRMTLDEKARVMLDESDAVPRLGIRKFAWWSEALHGVANQGNVTVFPEPIAMAASFNPELLYEVFDATSTEMRAKYHDRQRQGIEDERFHGLSVWTPNVNIFRDPRWGRGQETYGEDPYLTSVMGQAVVRGLQGPEESRYKKLLACAKHYAVHSGPEWSRHTANLNNVPYRDLLETYLPAFKDLVQKADVREVMCAYQRLDDEPCCGNTRLLQQILRQEWGFKYLVVSDCGAVTDFWTSHKTSSDAKHAAARGALSGTDVECGYDYAYKSLPDAVRQGLISERDVDERVVRLMEGRFDLGEMDDPELVPWSKLPMSEVCSAKHHQLSLDMARQTLTLLLNKQQTLPLSKSLRKVAVVGPNADDKPMMWGNYNGTPNTTITILDGIRNLVGAKRVIYDKGCDWIEDQVTVSLLDHCVQNGKPGIQAQFWNNAQMEGKPVSELRITEPINVTTYGQHSFGPNVKLQDFSACYQTEFTPSVTEEIVFRLEGASYYELWVNGESLCKSRSWLNIKKRIPMKVEKGKTYKVELRYAQVENWNANLKFNIGREVPLDYAQCVERLKDADVVIFAGGISPQLEGEEMPISIPGFKGGDRTDIELPAVQRQFLKALKDAGKTVILVHCSGSAMALVPEVESCDAILQAWYSGEAGGQAIAEVLFGDCNPSGKLPITFYKNSSQLPDFEDYAMKGRTYRYMTSEPLFPFGYGLSYTTFCVGDAQLDRSTLALPQGSVTLSIPVQNTGSREGTEVLQVYVRKVGDAEGPLKSLKAFQRVPLAAGQQTTVNIALPASAFEGYDVQSNEMRITPGQYELYYGTSSSAKDLKRVDVTLQ